MRCVLNVTLVDVARTLIVAVVAIVAFQLHFLILVLVEIPLSQRFLALALLLFFTFLHLALFTLGGLDTLQLC